MNSQSLNASPAQTDAVKIRQSSSAARFVVHAVLGSSTQVSSSGVITRAPTASPSHQVSHSDQKPASPVAPAKARLVMPMEALMVVANMTTATNFTTCATLLNGYASANRRIRKPAMTASSELPVAIVAATPPETPVDRLTRKAPAKMPGQARRPKYSSAAIAMPVGGHTGLVLACSNASDSPRRAAR